MVVLLVYLSAFCLDHCLSGGQEKRPFLGYNGRKFTKCPFHKLALAGQLAELLAIRLSEWLDCLFAGFMAGLLAVWLDHRMSDWLHG